MQRLYTPLALGWEIAYRVFGRRLADAAVVPDEIRERQRDRSDAHTVSRPSRLILTVLETW